jgi:hypothetical protein
MDFPDQDIVCRGVVTKKYEEGDSRYVELEVWTENPKGQRTTPGMACVILPTRG